MASPIVHHASQARSESRQRRTLRLSACIVILACVHSRESGRAFAGLSVHRHASASSASRHASDAPIEPAPGSEVALKERYLPAETPGWLARPKHNVPAKPLIVDKNLQRHAPDGAVRSYGPLRSITWRRSFLETLERGTNLKRGGLKGRYADEIKQHVAQRRELQRLGIQENITVFWDLRKMWLKTHNWVRPMKKLKRTMQMFAGMCDGTVTQVEAVEITRLLESSEGRYRSGKLNMFDELRLAGGLVHRAWPPIEDTVESVLMERFREHLDHMHETGEKTIFFFVAPEQGLEPIIEAAQSEGATVVHIGRAWGARYYPGGCDFSVPIEFERWHNLQFLMNNPDFDDPERHGKRGLSAPGMELYNPGNVSLKVHSAEEELKFQYFHSWEKNFTMENGGVGSRFGPSFLGRYVRPSLRLNTTLAKAFAAASNRTGEVPKKLKQWSEGKWQEYSEDGTKFLAKLEPFKFAKLTDQEREAGQRDLDSLSKATDEDYAVLYWNWDTHIAQNVGPNAREMSGRIIRYFEGFLNMSIRRVEVARWTEPWEKLGQHPLDWGYAQSQLDCVIHRVWPPTPETTNRALARNVATLARAARENRSAIPTLSKPPRVAIFLSDELIFDEALEDAQDAGISAIWLGPITQGAYYPAHSQERICLDIPEWFQTVIDLAACNRNPFAEGAHTPDAPIAVGQQDAVPMNLAWGTEGLRLDNSELVLGAEDQEAADKEGVSRMA